MTTSTRWVMVGLAVVVLSLVAAVASAAVRRRQGDTTAPGSTTGGSTGPNGTIDGGTLIDKLQNEPCLLVSGGTVQAGEVLYSLKNTPMVVAPDNKAAIVTERFDNEVVGTFTGKYAFNPNYFAGGSCFLQVNPTGAGAGKLLWVLTKHVYTKTYPI
ncbi:hypothetical protein [Fibrella aquatilis]|uniref:Uncharacterized protein n=1 Tax=Fibrella aquatilis TaxID=2817059 RepID=A0A939G4N3_9BACT|nr:hypothetical protein [Fibrella aquatilis]MBO0930360.1 hypothetical protein [Fibrella aquatilis]